MTTNHNRERPSRRGVLTISVLAISLVAVVIIASGAFVLTFAKVEASESAEVAQLRQELQNLSKEKEAAAAEAQKADHLRTKAQQVEREKIEQLRAQQAEIQFLESNPGSVQRTTTESSVVRRIRTAHGSFYVAHGDVEPEIEFRAAGPRGYLFPTYSSNPRRIELGYEAGEDKYPPPIQIPADLVDTHDWVLVKEPRLAGIHSQAVVDVGNVWALAERAKATD